MVQSVPRLDEIRAQDSVLVGGKAAKLGELAGLGFPVPPGFVVPAPACRTFLDSLDVQAELRDLDGMPKSALAEACAALRRRIVDTDLSTSLAEAIRGAHRRLLAESGPALLCAVRSSATAEDLENASFAGQHGTYYYVDGDHLLEMVRRCWASLFSPEAVGYRATHGIPQASVSMAVVVQELIPSDVSGVTFTAHPISGDRGEIVIESSWGMGAAIVDGRVTPDRYVVARSGLVLRERRVAEKRFMVPTQPPEGNGERLLPLPQGRQRAASLSGAEVRMVAEWSLRCEVHFGVPQDVEWAIAGGRFYLLQSRAITTLGREEIGEGVAGSYVLFKSLAENFTDPLTPFTEDLVSLNLPPGLHIIGGRAYFDLALLRPLFPFVLSDAELARLVYAAGPSSVPLRLSLRKLPVALLAGLAGYLVFAVVLARSRGMPDDFLQGYRALCRKVEADPGLDPVQAIRRLWLLPRLLDPIGHMAVFVNICSLRFMPWMALLSCLLDRFAPGLRPDALALLCSGSEGVLSAEMGRGINELARAAREDPVVREMVLHNPAAVARAWVAEEPAARGFRECLQAFLDVHGHRAVREFELRSARWEEDPTPVLGMVKNALLAEEDPSKVEHKAAGRRAEIEGELQSRLVSWPLERWLGLRSRLLRRVAGRARYYLKLRENSRFYHIMGFGVVRKKVLAIEAELLRLGQLKCKDDVFFLRVNEVDALRRGALGWPDVEDRIRERRLAHVRLGKATAPRTIGIARVEPPGEASPGGDLLRGDSASPGRFTGKARVILDPALDATLKPGEVLVAPYTDPAWTPLFLTAGAAVVEVGSFLSHAGTVAREFGMPCVVDVEDCTRRIQTGDLLDVDGNRGVIRILPAVDQT